MIKNPDAYMENLNYEQENVLRERSIWFTCEMVELLPGEVYTGDVILEDGVKKCQSGEYRVCENVGGYAMYADFVIEDMELAL